MIMLINDMRFIKGQFVLPLQTKQQQAARTDGGGLIEGTVIRRVIKHLFNLAGTTYS